MAATPKNGVFTFVGLQTKRVYNVSVYLSDVANAKITLSSRGLAGTSSDTFWTAPEPVKMVDYSQTTGTADTDVLVLLSDDNIVPGSVLDYVSYVSTSSQRPPINVNFRAGAKIGAIQLT